MSIKIGSITLSSHAGFDIRQSIDVIQARNLRRSKNGSLHIQNRWQKLQSNISGSGWLPDGLDGIDTGITYAVSCIAALSKAAASNIITIPRAYRTDSPYAPQGVAIVNDEPVETPLTLDVFQATLTTVSGATQYQVIYYPIITGAINISRQFDDNNNVLGWTIEVVEE